MSMTRFSRTLTKTNRSDIRYEVINWFLDENAGTGVGKNATSYYYTIETYDEYTIELHRPVSLNKGFDCTVNVTGMMFKKIRCHSNPSHNDIFSALTYCRNQHVTHYDAVIKPILNQIFNCHNVILSPASVGSFLDYNGDSLPIEIIILCVKWLFIEQDITYWNWSGRQKLYDELHSRNLI